MDEKKTFRQRWFPFEDNYDCGSLDFIGRWMRTIATGVTLSGLALWGGCQTLGNGFEYSKGSRTGMINKLSEKGLIWKTYEGQMALEGMVSGEGYTGANVWDFSLDRQARHGEDTKDIVNKINGYLETGTKVKVDYIEPFMTWPWRSGTNYLIQKVEPIKFKE